MKSLSVGGILLREEQPSDILAIHALTAAAFAPMPFSNGSEYYVIDQLRADGDLTLSLVAEDAEENKGAIIGHIAFSPVTISDGTADWYGLGPVSAAPALQKTGIGSKLIRFGIGELEERGAKGIVLIGSTDYYPRFGFEHRPDLTYAGGPPEAFQVLLLEGEWPSGAVSYSPAFS
ncbi:MAG: N-acetyltransferase [Erythrobacter sp.]